MQALPIQSATSLAFPWPHAHEEQRPAIKYLVRDVVWLAAVQQMVAAWRDSREAAMPLLECHRLDELPEVGEGPAPLLLMEIARDQLPRMADWLATRRRVLVVALLCRTSLATPDDRAAAAALLGEAGAALTLASPRQAAQLLDVIDHYQRQDARQPRDPLGELPLCCWDPAWQWPT